MNTMELATAIRCHAIDMTNKGKSSHIGSILSIADILAVLYGEILHHRPSDSKWSHRDRFILSKGHAGAGVYAVLAVTGYFSTDELIKHYSNGSIFSGHVSHKGVPGVEFSTGSLGHGLPVAAGMAFTNKMNLNDVRVYVLLGDGEMDEGSNWEAILFAAHHNLSNLVAIVDYNKLQSLAPVEETIGLEPFAKKWEAFGWRVKEVDGHNHKELAGVLNVNPSDGESPLCVVAHTIKGKGVSFMENSVLWHYRTPQGAEYDQAMSELTGE